MSNICACVQNDKDVMVNLKFTRFLCFTSLEMDAFLLSGGRLVSWQGTETSLLLAPMQLKSKPSCKQE